MFLSTVFLLPQMRFFRLQRLNSVAQEAQSKPKLGKNVVQPEHLIKAKDRFKMMKNAVHGLIQSLCPHNHQDVMSVLGVSGIKYYFKISLMT